MVVYKLGQANVAHTQAQPAVSLSASSMVPPCTLHSHLQSLRAAAAVELGAVLRPSGHSRQSTLPVESLYVPRAHGKALPLR